MYLPRECNRLADYFAGQASAAAKEAAGNPLVPLHHAALPPYQLAQSLGFIIEQGIASHVPAFVLTECPAPAPPELYTDYTNLSPWTILPLQWHPLTVSV